MEKKDSPLGLNDLTLLMAAYKNNIEFSMTLLEQEKQILYHQDEIKNKQDKLCESISNSQKECNEHVRAVSNFQHETLDCIRQFNSALVLDLEKKAYDTKVLFYKSYAGMITIIISLIGLAVILSGKI